MYIKKLKLKSYRNYKELDVDFEKGINIIYGNNAEGKTNILESLYLSSTTKSHKNSKEIDLINFNEEESHIKLSFFVEREKKDRIIDIQLNKKSKKGIAVDGIKKEKISEFIGLLNVIMFAPEDLYIIKDGPQARRKFLDIELCQIDKSYTRVLSDYNHVLNQRNALLKDISKTNGNNRQDLINLIDSFDEQLVNFGSEIIIKRKKNIEEIKPKIEEISKKISDNKENLIIDYETELNDQEEKIKEIYKAKLKDTREMDLKCEFTNFGPHRDDISFTIDEKDIRKFGSQGQKKTTAISLKIAELLLVKEKIKESPVLLLDDVFSELDETRQKLLTQNLSGIQTIITCTGINKNIFELLKPDAIYNVKNNNIKKIEKK